MEPGASLLSSPLWRPLLLSTLAGLSTTLGALLSIVHNPTEGTMAALLGMAIGVMATVSIVELVVKNALEHNALLVLVSTAAGAMVYYVLEPFIPKVDLQNIEPRGSGLKAAHDSRVVVDVEVRGRDRQQQQQQQEDEWERKRGQSLDTLDPGGGMNAAGTGIKSSAEHKSKLLRLGLLMALTMTLHNLPEGFAVAFSAFTPLGPVMAVAIAMHNIPEGLIIAAPIFAATGNRWKALGLATASGLSEPLGALVALLLLRPFLTVERLQYVLAGTGGLMLAVCVIELWPEARRCNNDKGLALGIVVGAIIMGWTLYVEGQAIMHRPMDSFQP